MFAFVTMPEFRGKGLGSKSIKPMLNYFDEHGIKYRQKSLSEGDYGFLITAVPELGFPVDTYFTDEVFIERKNSLQELAQSLYGHKQKRSNGKTEYENRFQPRRYYPVE